jgi:t-SNARE complex subunit (syntaxin)
LVHLLATREQEIRAIAAERDFLQDEVRVARGVTWEKDSDMQSVRSVNDQHVEENERLRAELDEWSSRTAKLELALELEHRSSLELHKKLLS